MTPLQIIVLVFFGVVTFGNTFLVQPDITWSPLYHALMVSLDVTLFWVALNLKQFSEMGRKADIIAPQAPIDAVPASLAPATAATSPTVSGEQVTIDEATLKAAAAQIYDEVAQQVAQAIPHSTSTPMTNTTTVVTAIPAPIVTQPPTA